MQDTAHPSAGGARAIRLRLLHTSDLHGALRGFDYLADRPSEVIGLARTATLLRAARAEARASGATCLFFDTGDALQGTPVCDLAVEHAAAFDAHPIITALDALGCDAMCVGNHDIDYGPEAMQRAFAGAGFPVLAANLFRRGPDSCLAPGPFPSRATLVRQVRDGTGALHDLRICVIGCLPPQTLDWNRESTASFVIAGMVDTLRDEARAARAEGCDLVIALAHTGLDPDDTSPMAENAALAIAALDDVDVVLAGHSHVPFPLDTEETPPGAPHIEASKDGLVNGTPITNPGAWGSHLGVIDLALEPAGTSATGRGWRVTHARAALRPISQRDAVGRLTVTTPEDPEILALTQMAHDLTRATLGEQIAKTSVPLNSYFSLIGPDAGLDLIGQAMRGHLRTVLRGTEYEGLPVLAAISPLKTGRRSGPEHFTDIPVGPLTRRHISDLLFYENDFHAIQVTGAFLREWLEISASLFSRLAPGVASDVPLFRHGVPGYSFDVLHGLTYAVDVSAPARYDTRGLRVDPDAWRIRDLRHDGRPVADADCFAVATHGYRVFGVGFPAMGDIPRPDHLPLDRVSSRDILTSHVRRAGSIAPDPVPNWRFAPLGGASALFHTGPSSRAHLDVPGLPQLEDLGNTPRGFAVFRVTL